MQPSSNNNNNKKTYPLTQERRAHLYQILNELDDEQLRSVLNTHAQNSSAPNKFQHYIRIQLFQQCLSLIDNYCTNELEQTLYSIRPNRFSSDYYQQQQQQQSLYYSQQTSQYNAQQNYRFPSSPAIAQQLRAIRPSPIASQPTNAPNSRLQQSQIAYSLRVPRPPHSRSSSVTIPNNSFTPVVQRYQVPLLPPTTSAPPPPPLPPSSSQSLLNLAATNNSQRLTVNKINHKNLPFYRPIACVYERYQIFRYDTYRKQHISHDEFILPFDVCNQLALSYDYDSNLNIHKTTKCLLLRLARIDQPATLNGKYEDNLPPNLLIHVNGNQLTNLPTPKASTRQQNDLLRIGREIDITSNCMFNPILKNDLTIAWSYRPENTNLQLQYTNAQYALHIFLVEHLTTGELRDQVLKKPMRFFREDLVRLLAKAHANDRDLGLEVSDQKLKLICPIDQRRLKTPVRATTCQHLQCFDLTNYIALNEKSNKWICPVCNKSALFEDLQIDSHTESILDSIHNENITEITIDSGLNWTPINPPNSINDPFDLKSNMRFISSSSSSLSNDIIFLDGDD